MIFVWIFVILLVIVLILDRLVERMYRNERKSAEITPQKYGIPFDELYIPAKDGTQLYAWWAPTSATAPVIILVHGWGRNLSRMLPYLRELHAIGYNLLAFDARNHGKSSRVSHPTVETFTQDIVSVVEYLALSGKLSSLGFGIVGLSIGGGAALNASAWDKRVKSVVTIGAFSHPVEVMNLEFRKRNIPAFIPRLLFGYMRLRFRIDFDKIAPINNIPDAEANILLIHGDKDDTIPLVQGQALARAGKAEKTQLWVVPGKGHSNCDSHPLFWEKLRTFLCSTLPLSRQETV